jgi:hypothetical protein
MAGNRVRVGNLRLRVGGISADDAVRLANGVVRELSQRMPAGRAANIADLNLRLTQRQASSPGQIAQRIADALGGRRR